ncbi:toll/interleukin-1 receptor domain-containing protein [Chryseobacterium sp. Tr-659]|uniref:toll/interleukin-1 receptor domain-containing protein n=1 Tax=Chryseobacterium sp. Tr-659 TaxID=2608340 RepID=UPI00142103C0|nr:toll/interleukin-1 receptor domain-containing protein [Chryseobacterium sp. Tr-659]NIF03963.1 toll/interleukin-1 receptor domain-containing protein [Chryseobacterium sp. Tr-659]
MEQQSKTINLFIDYLFEDRQFAEKIIRRLSIFNKENVSIFNYEIISDGTDLTNGQIADRLYDFDIIICIVTPDYLASTKDIIEDTLNELADKNNKYIIPIIYTPTNWSSKKWIVGNRIFPKNDLSISELNDLELERTLNSIIETIESIILQNKYKTNQSNISIKDKQELIFISHSHDDSDFAELLKLKLEKANINCWIDSEKLKIGQEWRQEIDDGISRSKAVIVIMTPEARKSEYVTYEWAYAWGKNKKIFPIMLKQTTLHPRLESLQYLDFTNKASRPYSELILSLQKI